MQDFAPLSSAAENVLTSCTQQYPTTLNISLPTLKWQLVKTFSAADERGAKSCILDIFPYL
jgi:hypothetical protein